MLDYNSLVKAMVDYFKENGLGRSTEYYFGYFDALALVRRLQDEEKMK